MAIAVETSGLTKRYKVGGTFLRRAERTALALSDVNLKVHSGEVFGVVGRNGYGKTTLMKCIASLLLPTAGSIRVFGRDVEKENAEVRKLIGWVGTEERSFYFRLTGEQNLRFFAHLQGIASPTIGPTIAQLGEKFGVTELLGRRFHEYSTGNKQKFAIMRGLLHDPRLLILDEPSRSLDPFAADDLRDHLRDWVSEKKDRTILVTSHNLSEVEELSDRVAIMSRGRLRACGPVDELRKSWGQSETISLLLKSQPSNWQTLQKNLRSGRWDELPSGHGSSGHGWLRFEHAPGDGTFPELLSALVREKSNIVSVDRQVLTLQDIIDRVDEAGTLKMDADPTTALPGPAAFKGASARPSQDSEKP